MRESNTPTNNLPDPDPESPGLCIDINRLHEIDLDCEFTKSVVRQIVTDQCVHSAEISIAIVSDEQIHELNRQYLQHDYETDVLSFNLGTESAGFELSGEIVVSADTARRCAQERNIKVIDELTLYVIHGTLHLLGFDDKSEAERKKMRAAEREYARLFGLEYRDPDGAE